MELLSMDPLVPPALILNIALDDVLVGVLPDGVHVKTTRPEIASPQDFLDLGTGIEDMLARKAFDNLGDVRGREYGDALDEEMDMILIGADLDETNLVALLDLQAHVFECFLDRLGKGLFSVFHGTNQMVEQECLVVTFDDVFAHPMMLHLRESTSHSECEVFSE
jgi:hypothetical protein